jgi:hypothetical protein
MWKIVIFLSICISSAYVHQGIDFMKSWFTRNDTFPSKVISTVSNLAFHSLKQAAVVGKNLMKEIIKNVHKTF